MKKSIFLFFAAILCASSAWAANVGFESSGNTMKYYSNLKSSDQTVNLDRTNGTTTNLGAVTALYLKGFACKMYQDADNTIWGGDAQHAYYKIHRTAVAAGASGYTDVTNWNWNWQNWSNGWRYPTGSKSLDVNLLSGLGSGKYSMTYYFQQKGSSTWRLPSSTSKYNVLKWTIDAPKVTSASCTSNGTGLGTEESPFMIPVGETLTLTVDGEQSFSDANSVLNVKFGDNAYSSTVTYTLTPTTTKQSITIKVKYYNSTDDLSGTEETLIVYFEALEEETNDVIVSYLCNSNPIAGHGEQTVAVGITTPSGINAPAISGYTFSSWELGDGIIQKSTEGNAITIITKTGFNESDYTLVANYTEDLTTGWTLKGSFVDDFATAYDFTKKSGESTGKVAYTTLELDAHKEYHFKVVNGGTWYGNNNYNEGNETHWIKQTTEGWEFYGDAGNCYMKSGLAGTYTFKIDYSGTYPQVSVYYPEIYAIVGTFNEWNENTNKLNFDGNIGTATINLEASATNYEFKVIDNAVHGGIVNKTITQTENDLAITVGGGDNIKLTANANPKGDYIFTYDKSTKKLSVTYPTVYTITTNAENGSVEGAGTYVEGTEITLTATAEEGYEFTGWSNGETANPYTFEVTEDITLTANFDLKSYTITAKAENGTVTGAGTYDHGANVTLTATANEGYKFVNWTKEDVEVSTDATYTFTATENAELVANFKATTITLTTGNNDAVIAANIGNTVNVVIERSFTANDGYYTLCVPFDMDPSVIGKAYSLGNIKKHVSGEGIDIDLEEEKYMISAGVPYLVLPKANMSELVVEDVTIQPYGPYGQNVGNPTLNINIFFQGYYSASGQTNGTTQYYVGKNGWLYNEVVDIRGLCGLFTITDNKGNPAKVRARVVTREDAATGLDNITNGENTTIKLIENGQLIIIRNGEKFNAQGVRF